MPHPTSLRLPAAVKDRLDRSAERANESSSSRAVRLIDEGLRMEEHPGVAFHASAAHGRAACLAGGPDIAEVVDVLTGLEATGEQRLAETAAWFGVHPSRVRVALGYYSDHRDEVDQQIAVRHRTAAELRGRYEAEQDLLE